MVNMSVILSLLILYAKVNPVSTVLVCDCVCPNLCSSLHLYPRVPTKEIGVTMPTVVDRALDDTVIKTADRM